MVRARRGGWVLCDAGLVPGQLDEFVDLVVPELQRRALYRKAYTGTMFRDHLGLSRPAIGEYAAMMQHSKAAAI